MTLENGLQFLLALGFEEAGEWLQTQAGISCVLSRHSTQSSILYAFVSQNQVLYIGKSIRMLKQRMYGYQKPGPSQRTNIVNHANIKQSLTNGDPVLVYVFAPQEQLRYRGIPVNLAAGLEDTLISTVQPIWNRAGLNG